MASTRNRCLVASSRKAFGVRYFAAVLSLTVVGIGSDALARNHRHAFNQFAGIPQSADTKSDQAKWKGSSGKPACIDQDLRPRGSNTSALTEPSIPPSDERASLEGASCQNRIAQSILLTKLTSAQTDPYSVDG